MTAIEGEVCMCFEEAAEVKIGSNMGSVVLSGDQMVKEEKVVVGFLSAKVWKVNRRRVLGGCSSRICESTKVRIWVMSGLAMQ